MELWPIVVRKKSVRNDTTHLEHDLPRSVPLHALSRYDISIPGSMRRFVRP